MTPHLSFFALALAAGIGIPIMAAMNANLGGQIGNPVTATVILFIVALSCALGVLAYVGLPPKPLSAAPTYTFIGGVFVAFYALSITWAAPHIGVGNAVFFVLLGQMIAATMLDHWALFGAVHSPVTLRRLAGLGLMAIGLYLARRTV